MNNLEIQQTNKMYRTGHSIVYSCQYHVIWCTKYRRTVIDTPAVENRLKELILEKQIEYEYIVMAMEIMPDHVHLILDVNPQLGVVSVVGKIKGYTSNMIRSEFPKVKSRIPSLWTRSKFISTVGTVSLETVKKYIEDQKNK